MPRGSGPGQPWDAAEGDYWRRDPGAYSPHYPESSTYPPAGPPLGAGRPRGPYPPRGTRPPYQPPPPPPRKRKHKGRRIFLWSALGIIVIIVIASVASSSGKKAAPTSSPGPSAPAAAVATRGAAPSPSPKPVAQTITYVVTGSPADVTYGPAGTDISGTVPMSVTQPLGTPAYYAITAQLNGSGDVKCAIEIDGKAISTGEGSGSYNIASCEISQDPLTGSWQSDDG
jgi:hypothetical protein